MHGLRSLAHGLKVRVRSRLARSLWRSALLLALGLIPGVASRATAERGLPARDDIGNFRRVSERLFRGAQPDLKGMESLRRMGVRSIINLRQPTDVWQPEPAQAAAAGIFYTNVPLHGLKGPTQTQIRHILSLIQTLPAPVFVHCQYGCDRTGTVVACYRIECDAWTSDRALAEARVHGMSRMVPGMRRFVRDFGKARGR
jgi:tyrosine-protein phosphatase SIW14